MRARLLVLPVIAAAALTAGCSAKTEPDPAIASLESRVATVEDHLAGVEAVVGQALIAEPAQQLQNDIDQLAKDVANAQLPADVQADIDAAKQAAADAQKAADAAIAAEQAEDAATADAIAAAQKAIADARAKVDAAKQKVKDWLEAGKPVASPAASP